MNFVVVASILFALGLYGVLTRRDIIAVLASIELMLGAATVMLIGLGGLSALSPQGRADAGTIEATGLLLLVMAAAAAAVGLAILVAIARSTGRTRIDELTEIRDRT